MNGPVVNLDQLDFTRDLSHGDKFEARIAPIGIRLGALKLGYNVTAVPPGKRAFPFHNHHANEEMFFVLEGEGQVESRTLERPYTIVGRDPGVDLPLVHPLIKSRQAYLQVIAGRLFCIDLGGRLRVVWEGAPGRPNRRQTHRRRRPSARRGRR